MNRTWQVVFAFVGIFIAGGVVGLFLAPQVWKRVVQQRVVEQLGPIQLTRLTEDLKLTPEQIAKVQPLIDRATEDYRRLRKEGNAVSDRLEEDFKKELTQEQRDKYLDIRTRRRDRDKLWQRWLKEQRAKHELEHPGEPPPLENPAPADAPAAAK
jgi:hypothetical protein